MLLPSLVMLALRAPSSTEPLAPMVKVSLTLASSRVPVKLTESRAIVPLLSVPVLSASNMKASTAASDSWVSTSAAQTQALPVLSHLMIWLSVQPKSASSLASIEAPSTAAKVTVSVVESPVTVTPLPATRESVSVVVSATGLVPDVVDTVSNKLAPPPPETSASQPQEVVELSHLRIWLSVQSVLRPSVNGSPAVPMPLLASPPSVVAFKTSLPITPSVSLLRKPASLVKSARVTAVKSISSSPTALVSISLASTEVPRVDEKVVPTRLIPVPAEYVVSVSTSAAQIQAVPISSQLKDLVVGTRHVG